MEDMIVASVVAGVPELEHDAHLVVAELRTNGHNLSDYIGLNKALELVGDGKPLFLTSFMRESDLADDVRYLELNSYPNVSFIRLPFRMEDLRKAVVNPQERFKPDDPLARELAKLDQNVNLSSYLAHDLRYLLEGRSTHGYQDFDAWRLDAKKVWGDLTDEELIGRAQEGRYEAPDGTFANSNFRDIFVDVEGTLLVNGELRKDIVTSVKSFALNEKRPVTIWTGGDVKSLAQKLRQFGISWKITSKYLFKGATVDMTYDDMTKDQLFASYGINTENHVKV